MTSFDGKNQFSMEYLRLPKPGNSKPSISIMLASYFNAGLHIREPENTYFVRGLIRYCTADQHLDFINSTDQINLEPIS